MADVSFYVPEIEKLKTFAFLNFPEETVLGYDIFKSSVYQLRRLNEGDKYRLVQTTVVFKKNNTEWII